MIKDFKPQPFGGPNPLPDYVFDTRTLTLVGTVPGGYKITLGRLTIGETKSGGNLLTHALFESFSDHGERLRVARTRVSGYDREFIAARNAMIETGIDFFPTLPCSCEAILESLGDWFVVQNPEITQPVVVSQTCH